MVVRFSKTPSHYEGDKNARFVLGSPRKRTLVVFGINPSTANNKYSDRTIARVIALSKHWKYDGWLMVNVYPHITTKPKHLPKKVDEKLVTRNKKEIDRVIRTLQNYDICAAWGNLIRTRKYLLNCVDDLLTQLDTKSWFSMGSLTKKGHPRHPLYLGKENRMLKKLDMQKYLRTHSI